MARYWVGGTGNTNDTAHWSASSGGAGSAGVPTAADDVIFDANSGAGTVTINAALACRSIASAGSSIATLAHNSSITVSVGDASGGSVDLSGFTAYNKGSATSSAFSFVSTTTGNTIKSGGRIFGNVTFNGLGGVWTLQDDLTSSGTLTLTAGNLKAGTHAMTLLAFGSTTGTAVRQLDGGPTITVTGTGTVWNSGTTNATHNVSATKLIIGDASASTKTLSLGGTWGEISYTNAGTGTLAFTSFNPTIGTLTVSGAARTVSFTNGKTYTITTAFNVTGTAGNLISLVSATPGSAYTLSKSGAGVSVDYLSIRDSAATGGAQWFAGAHSTSVSGNTGWVFTAPGWSQAVADSLALADSRTSQTGKALTDSAVLTDVLAKALHVQLTDSAVLTDSVQDAIGLSLSDALGLADQLSRHAGHAIGDALPVTDSTKRRYPGAHHGQGDVGTRGKADRGVTE